MRAMTRKAPKDLRADKLWAAKHLARGAPVWCVRWKAAGGVVAFVAEDIRGWAEFDGVPVAEFNVQPLYMRDGKAWFGPECEWPKEEGKSVCPNCGQWQHEGNYGDCVNECVRRGFAPRKEDARGR